MERALSTDDHQLEDSVALVIQWNTLHLSPSLTPMSQLPIKWHSPFGKAQTPDETTACKVDEGLDLSCLKAFQNKAHAGPLYNSITVPANIDEHAKGRGSYARARMGAIVKPAYTSLGTP